MNQAERKGDRDEGNTKKTSHRKDERKVDKHHLGVCKKGKTKVPGLQGPKKVKTARKRGGLDYFALKTGPRGRCEVNRRNDYLIRIRET